MIPLTGSVVGTVRPPGSKSLTNRALITAALATGASRLTGVLDSRDTQVMLESLKRLGLAVTADAAARTIDIVGCGGSPPVEAAELWLENSGTSIRFLTAMCTLGRGHYRLDGNARMRQRPIGDLLAALNELGANCRAESGSDCPPVVVEAAGLPGGETTVNTSLSSQYLSALLMAAPCATQDVTVHLTGPLVSEPYIDMTLGVMARFGVTVETPVPGIFRIPRQQYRAANYDIEPDASAASYFFALAAITNGKVTVDGLNEYALQGDVRFVDALQQMGCVVHWGQNSVTVEGRPLRGIDIDMNAISDTAQTLAAVAPFANGPTTIRNIAHVRHKETDRISAVTTELRKLGLDVVEFADGMTIHPGPMRPAEIDTYDDHRMAMSLALIGLRQPGVVIRDPGCTSKTYPEFFVDLGRLTGSPARPIA
jgi:3-phosphoshikimate 1-carboxyvinyltransferase